MKRFLFFAYQILKHDRKSFFYWINWILLSKIIFNMSKRISIYFQKSIKINLLDYFKNLFPLKRLFTINYKKKYKNIWFLKNRLAGCGAVCTIP